MNKELYEKIMGLLDVAVDQGVSLSFEFEEEMDEKVCEIIDNVGPEVVDYIQMNGMILALTAIYKSMGGDTNQLAYISEKVINYANDVWEEQLKKMM